MNPKLFKFIMSLAVVTSVALVYVHQQVELVKLSYAVEERNKGLKDMLDYKESLSYDVYNLNAPARLEKVLSAKKIEMAFPKRCQIVKVARASSNVISDMSLKRTGIERKINIFGIFEFFGLRAEAQAKEK